MNDRRASRVGLLLRRLRKFAAFFSYFRQARKCWCWPKKSEVLIFDACGAELLRDYLRDWSVEVLPVRGESINVPVMLASLFVGGNRSEAYFDVYIRRVRPLLIVTFIDNTPAFYRLASRHPGVKTMFIQNGWRGYHADVFEQLDASERNVGSLAVDYMLCFGHAVGRHYQRYIAGTAVAIGALRNNRQLRSAAREAGSIAFVSQWRSEGIQCAGRVYSQEEFMGAIDRCIVSFVADYARAHGKRLSIIPRTPADSDQRREEAQYFEAMLGEPCRFLEYDKPGSSYQALDAAEVVVGVDSTLVYEAIARGTRTAVFSIRGALMGVQGFGYGWPAACEPDGPFWTNTPAPERFAAVLDYLFGISDDDWRKELQGLAFEELMVFDPGNALLRQTLAQALAPRGSNRTVEVARK